MCGTGRRCRVEEAAALARDITRRYKSGFAELILCASDLFRGRPQLVRLAFENGPGDCPQNPWCVFQVMAGLAEGDYDHVLRAVAFAEGLTSDPLISMCSFLGQSVRGDPIAAADALSPEVEAVLWQDFQYTECVATGFAVLGDVTNLEKWLGRSVELGMGYCALTAHQHATWSPWLDHSRVAPLMGRCRDNAERYAALPLAPRLAMMDARVEAT